MKKRIFSMLLALCMVISMLPLGSIRARATVTDDSETNSTDSQQTGDVGEIIVGEGTDTSRRVPLDNLFNYSAVQYVIPATELEDVVGKGFFALTYYCDNPNLLSNTRSLAIYLQEVESPTLQGFADVDQGSQVFSGSAQFTGSELHIELDDPYLYSGKDLLVTVIDSTGAWKGTVYFYGTAALGDAVYAYRDNAPYDVGALDGGTQIEFTPKMKISTADSAPYRVTAGDCDNGTVSASREIAYAGQKVELEAVPAEGYCLRAFTVLCGEETVEVSEDGTFVMPDGDVTVTAEFRKLDRYSITVNEAANGTVTAVETAYETDTVTLKFIPAEGYILESLTAENNDALVFSKVNDTTYTFVMPAENVTIVPTFAEKSTIVLELTDSFSDGWSRNAIRVFLDGSETPLTEDISLDSGSEETYTLNVPKNATLHFYWIKGSYANECGFTITRDGLMVYEAQPGSLKDTENETLLCTSRPLVYYDVTVTETTNGTVAAPTSFAAGQQLTLGITPDTDYILDSLTVTCSDGTPVEVDQNYSFTMPESNIIVTAVFRIKQTYNITVSETVNGTVTAAQTCRETESVKLTVSADRGYALGSITVMQGETLVEVDEDYTFIMPAGDVTVTATFIADPHIVEHGRTGCETVWFSGFVHQDEWADMDTQDADGDGYNWEWVEDSSAHQNMCLMSQSRGEMDEDLDPDNWLITPVFRLEEDLGYEFVFAAKSKSGLYWETVGLFVTTDLEGEIDADTLEQVGEDIIVSNNWTDYAFDLTEYAGQDIRVIVRHYNTNSKYLLLVDCMRLYAGDDTRYEIVCGDSPYGTVTADRATAMVGQTVKLTYAPKVGYQLQNISVMQGQTQVEVNADGTFTMPAGDVTVTVSYVADTHMIGHFKEGQELIWFNGFQSDADLSQMQSWDRDGDGYEWYDGSYSGYGHEDAQLYSLSYYVDGLDPDDLLFTPVFHLAANSSYRFAFLAESFSSGYPDTMGVFITTDLEGQVDEDSLVQLGSDEVVPAHLAEYEYDLSAYAGQDIRVVIRHYNSYNMYALLVDCMCLYQGVYSVTINSNENGTVTADKTTAKGGETVTLAVTPNAGYALESLTVMQGDTPVEVSEDYTFVMPTGDVTVSAQWAMAMIPVAMILETGTEYGTLDAALKAAAKDQTVKLLEDVTWSGLVKATNLDLNGHVLTVDDYMVVFNDSQILDSSESNSGLLVLTETAQKYLKLPINNVQLPVYGSRIGVEDSRKGYAFVEVEKFNSAVRGDGSDFAFQPVFEPVAVAALAENLAESRVKVIVRVSWANDKGEARSQDFLYSDALVQSFLDSYDAAGDRFGKMFTLKLKSGLVQDFSFQVLVKSDIGSTIASDSLRNSAE